MGLTQEVVAQRAGVNRANYAAVEAGRRTPGPGMRQRLASALSALPGDVLDIHRDEVMATIRNHGFSQPKVFGSVATNTDTPFSDIDILVRPTSLPTDLLSIVALETDLEAILTFPVDVVIDSQETNDVFADIRRQAVPLA